jgi:hydrogenase nickel incorporation protein HypB
MMEVRLAEDLMQANNRLAEKVKSLLSSKGILTLNFLSSPGAGKTTLLEETLKKVRGRAEAAVIVGDVQTSRDKQRFEKAGFKAVQINTEGGCHLTAGMVEKALSSLDLSGVELLFIENVGNLVCPAEFSLGENFKAMILSVAEGDDKPLKYPLMFRESSVLLINKIDLLPYCDCQPSLIEERALKINPRLTIFRVSCRTGEGLDQWADWLRHRVGQRSLGENPSEQ